MSYIKATDILPQEILDLIQNYVDGEYIYIPRKEWGEGTVIKNETSVRNSEIYEKYKAGVSVKVLSEEYYLSLKSIQRIISKMKRENQ